jgi:hypothetical protein
MGLRSGQLRGQQKKDATMALFIRQQWLLRRIEYSLRRSDPRLVALMVNFPKFALVGTVPAHERLKRPAVWRFQVVISAMLGIGLLSAYAVHRCCAAIRRYLDLNRAGLPDGTSKQPGPVDAS